MQANVLDFCRARETLRKAMERTQAERNDANELKRSVQGQVCEMMRKREVECVEVPDVAGSRFVRVTTTQPRPPPIKGVEEALQLVVPGLAPPPTGGTETDYVEHVTAEVRRRLSQRPVRGEPKTKVSLLSTTSKAVAPTPFMQVPPELQHFARQLVKVDHDRRKLNDDLKPLRQSKRETEKRLIESMQEDGSVAFRQQQRDQAVKTYEVRKRAQPVEKRPVGVRLLVECARTAAKDTFHRGQEDGYVEGVFAARMKELLEQHLTTTYRLKVARV